MWLLWPAAAGWANERILSFDSLIHLNYDGSMEVAETIKVESNGDQIKHGIYRDFPTQYEDRWGNHVRVGFSLLDVERDGIREDYHFGQLNNGLRIYIGNKDVFINAGEHTFKIRYLTNRQLGFFKDHDELYWNVTGNGWVFPIEEATATVELPQRVVEKVESTDGFTGAYGSTDKSLESTRDYTGNLVFKTTRPLDSYEGLSIVVSWPKGLVKEPGLFQRIMYFLQDNHELLLVIVFLLIINFYYLYVWYLHGRDPVKGTVIPLFELPKEFTPAIVRYLFTMGFDNKVFTSALINMAVKGYLSIREQKSEFVLERQDKGLKEPLSQEEETIAQTLFGRSKQMTIERGSYNETLDGSIDSLKESLERKLHDLYFITNQGYFFVGLMMSVASYWGISFLTNGRLTTPALFLLIVGLVLTNLIYHRLLKAPTLQGRKIMDQIEGFKMYLSTAEGERLNQLKSPQKTPELFEKFLPFALALGVEQQWSQQFNSVLTAAAAAGQAYAPSWYYMSGHQNFNVSDFSNHVSHSFSSTISSAATPPSSSSGGGGGGFSGGGGGGGGGGGW